MWPWEHLAVGYICYSAWARYRHGRPPTDGAVLMVAFATQLPDLIDKPLAWGLGLLPNGRSLGHSLVFALPTTVATLYAFGRRLAAAFVIGYVSHLLSDVFGYWVVVGTVSYGYLLWPFVERPAVDPPNVIFQVNLFLNLFQEFLGSPEGQLYLLFESVLLGAALILWARDGYPGLPPFTPGENR